MSIEKQGDEKVKIGKSMIPIVAAMFLFSCSQDTATQEKQGNPAPIENTETENSQQAKVQLEEKYFNEVITVDGQEVIKNVDNILIFVNKESASLPANYKPSDLVIPDVRFSFTTDPTIEKAI